MSESQQPSQPGQPQSEPQQPQPPAPRKFVMPGDVYVRPGIDDRPDPDKVLSAADKAAIARLSIRLPQNKAEASVTQSGLQSTRMATEVTPAVAAATIDAAMPDPDSAYLDMRDPVVAADGTRPTKGEVLRLKLGFVAGALLCSVPWAAATGTLLPAWLDRFGGAASAVPALCLLNALGAVIAFCSQTMFASTSDGTHSKFGRRTLWIVAGGLITGLAMWAVASLGGAAILPRLVVILWCVTQACYGMLIGPFVSVMADRVPDKFRPSADAWYGTGLAVAQMLGGFAGALFVGRIHQGLTWGAASLALAGIVAVIVWPREKSSLEMRLPRNSMDDAFASLSLKGKVPGFRRVFWSRLFLMTAAGSVSVVAFFVAKYGVFAAPSAGEAGNLDAAMLVAWMGLVTFVVSLLAAWASGPIADRFGAWGPSLAGVACVAVGALLPIALPGTALGLLLFAGFAGFGLGLFNAVGQELVAAVLPDPRDAGRMLGTLNLAATLSVVLGALVAWAVLDATGSYVWLFAASAVLAAVSAAFTVSVRGAFDRV